MERVRGAWIEGGPAISPYAGGAETVKEKISGGQGLRDGDLGGAERLQVADVLELVLVSVGLLGREEAAADRALAAEDAVEGLG